MNYLDPRMRSAKRTSVGMNGIGENYGWPKIGNGINYDGAKFTDETSLPDVEQPLRYRDPFKAPSTMAFITFDGHLDWKDNLLVGSLKFLFFKRR